MAKWIADRFVPIVKPRLHPASSIHRPSMKFRLIACLPLLNGSKFARDFSRSA
jgi:hypothetical protein